MFFHCKYPLSSGKVFVIEPFSNNVPNYISSLDELRKAVANLSFTCLLFCRQETRDCRSDESNLYRLKEGSGDGLLDQDFYLLQSKTGNQSGMDIRT